MLGFLRHLTGNSDATFARPTVHAFDSLNSYDEIALRDALDIIYVLFMHSDYPMT